ncbi:MAG: SPOR domain-containing protein [Terracidiphilus sp.]|jgi:cell division septation protein DedD
MNDDFNPDEFRPAEYRHDTELTLGPMMLLGLFFGLMLLCGLCFGVGYSLGSRGAHESPAPGQQPSVGAAALASSLPKPSAVQKTTSRPPSAVATVPTPAPSATSAQPVPALPVPAIKAEPETVPEQALMVQIATVSSQEDADILISALSKRGYTATARRDATDNKLHVRIGPFTNRSDANTMCRRLLNDGYNAIVQP